MFYLKERKLFKSFKIYIIIVEFLFTFQRVPSAFCDFLIFCWIILFADSVIHGFTPVGRANHYMSSLKADSILKVDRFEVTMCSSMYKITDHPFLICFISLTIIDEAITDAPEINLQSRLDYSTTSEFYLLILYPTNLLTSLTSSDSFLIVFLRFSVYSITSSANSDGFTSSFPILIPFISFTSLIAGV